MVNTVNSSSTCSPVAPTPLPPPFEPILTAQCAASKAAKQRQGRGEVSEASRRESAVSVIGRTVQVLDVLAEAPFPVTLTEIANTTELPLTTVHRLCSELLAEGFIERAGAAGLRIGPTLWEFGRRYERAEKFRTAAARYLQDLHAVTRGTVELTQLVGGRLVVVDRLVGSESPRAEWTGRVERLSLVSSAAGISVLAESTPAIVEECGAVLDERARLDLHGALREARETGAAMMPDGEGRLLLAACIRGREGIKGAVSLVARDAQTARSHIPSVLVTARRIAASLESS
ncbi:hypothetical protein C2138_12980 [Salinibacterium hongtaonis]|nr:hypothetical protein C2138_12980 [Salinibacterium hongtaonis]